MFVYRRSGKLWIGHRSDNVAAEMISALCLEQRLQCSSNIPQTRPDHHGQHFIFTIFFIPHLLHLHLALSCDKQPSACLTLAVAALLQECSEGNTEDTVSLAHQPRVFSM